IAQSASVFVRESAMIKGTVLPLSTYVFKQFAQELIRFAYALAGCIVVCLWSGLWPGPGWLLAIPGLALMIVATPAATIIMGLLGARFRDMSFIAPNLLRVGMFLT